MRYEEVQNLIDHRGYDLAKKFDHYNRLCFDGALPKIPLRFATLKKMAGKCACKWKPTPGPRRLRYIGATLEPGTIRIVLDKTYLRDEQTIDSTLIHEMIHAWFYLQNDFAENHGLKFIAKLRECEAKVDFKIPLTERLSDPVMADLPLRRVNVLLWQRAKHETLYAVINPVSFAMIEPTIKAAWDARGSGLLSAYEVRDAEWTQQAQRVPVQRPRMLFGYKSAVQFYYLRREGLVDALKANGTLLFEVRC